jgi:peptide/nickel transport system ATP-binding protein
VMYLGRLVERGPARRSSTGRRHPYTAMLLDALPDVDGGARDAADRGRAANPSRRPRGAASIRAVPTPTSGAGANGPSSSRPMVRTVACHAVAEGRLGALASGNGVSHGMV